MPFSCVTFPWRTSTSASLSAKFQHTIPNTIQMYVYRCTLYTTLQNAGWTRKAGYSLSAVSAHFLRACGHCLRMISSLQENESRVLPGMRKKGVAPRSRYMCKYTHLAPVIYPGFAKGVSSSIVHCISKTTFLPTLRIPLGWMNSECLPYCWNSASKSHRHLLDCF